MSYQLNFRGYCGMHMPVMSGDQEDCRDKAAEMIREHRRSGRYVLVLASGECWEFLEDENGMMVNDDEGILALKEV